MAEREQRQRTSGPPGASPPLARAKDRDLREDQHLEVPAGGRTSSRLLADGTPMEDLGPYDRATVSLWRRSYTQLTEQPESRQLVEAAMHAVLAGLRRWSVAAELFTAYEEGTPADFAMARSVLPSDVSEEVLWRVREAAFYLRYLELAQSDG